MSLAAEPQPNPGTSDTAPGTLMVGRSAFRPGTLRARRVANEGAVILDVASTRRRPHQDQYDDPVSAFFDMFNQREGRDTLFGGYIRGYLANKPDLTHVNSKALDFGCGTGWLAQQYLAGLFKSTYGVDTSSSMLTIARDNRKRQNQDDMLAGLMYYMQAPDSIIGKCDFLSAVHVHYHFDNLQKLKEDFFQVAASLLKPEGEMVLIGCPSAHIHRPPYHYFNSVHVSDIPDSVRDQSDQFSLLADEDDEYIALQDLPKFPLKDGTQMRVTFRTADDKGRAKTISLTDTYWSDETLQLAAAEYGLALQKFESISHRGHANAYMAMHFKKTGAPASAPCVTG